MLPSAATAAATKGAGAMSKLVRCTCGVELRGSDEADLIPRVRQHAKEAHDLDLSDDQIRDMMEVEQ